MPRPFRARYDFSRDWERPGSSTPFALGRQVVLRVLYLTDVSVGGPYLANPLARMLTSPWDEPHYGFVRVYRWGDRGAVVLVIKQWYSVGHAQGAMTNLLDDAAHIVEEEYTGPYEEPFDYPIYPCLQYIERFPVRHVRVGHLIVPSSRIDIRYWRWGDMRDPNTFVFNSFLSVPSSDRLYDVLRMALITLLSRRYVPNMRIVYH